MSEDLKTNLLTWVDVQRRVLNPDLAQISLPSFFADALKGFVHAEAVAAARVGEALVTVHTLSCGNKVCEECNLTMTLN